jgi:hypothetical protein
MTSTRDLGSLSEQKRLLLDRYLRGEIRHESTGSQVIQRRPPGEKAPLAFAQEELWRREQATAIPALYNEIITIRKRAPLDVAALERSLTEIARRHEVWRTTYTIADGKPIQVVHEPAAMMHLPIVDLQHLPEAEADAAIRRLASEQAQKRFDFVEGPLWRAVLFRTITEDRLCIVAHLSIVDGISVYQVLPVELASLYTAFSRGRGAPLSDVPLQYGDYAYWQHANAESEQTQEQLGYWRKQLSGDLPVLAWPHRPRPPVQTFRGVVESFAVGSALTNSIRELSRGEGVTVFTILFSAFACVLAGYTKQQDLIIGTRSPAGRKHAEVQKLLGYFLNPVAVRIDLNGDPTFRQVLLLSQRAIAGAISNDDIPFEKLAAMMDSRRDPSRNPLFTVAISLQPTTPEPCKDWHVTSMDGDSGGAVWDLYIAFIDSANGLVGRAQYNPDVCGREDIDGLIRDLTAILKKAVADPLSRASALMPAPSHIHPPDDLECKVQGQ